MKVLMLSTDEKILGDGTEARRRMIEYGALFEELHIVVLTTRKFQVSSFKFQIIGNVFIYPTNSWWKIARLWDAYKIAKTIIIHYSLFTIHSVITAQDAFETGFVGYFLKRKSRTLFKSAPEPRCEECARDARRDEESVAAALQLRGATPQPAHTPATRRDTANCPHRGVATPSEYPADTPSEIAPGAAGQLAPIAARRTFEKGSGIPLQVQAHTDFFSPYFAAESWKNRLRVLIGRRIVRAADGVRTVSERVKRTLVGEGDVAMEKISVLPIFVDVEKLRVAPPTFDLKKKYPQFGFIVLVASRLTTEKNVGLAIAAMRDVVKKYPHAGLVIVGDGPERKALELQIANYKLHMHVVFEGWTNDLASYYKGADVYLMTSNYEGYGRTAIEAAACGLPVVMTDVGLAGEFIVDGFNGIVCPVGNTAAITEALLRLIEKPSLRQKMGAHHNEVLAQLPSKGQYLARYKEILEKTIYTR